MNEQDNKLEQPINENLDQTEVQITIAKDDSGDSPRKRTRPRTLAPVQVNDVEDARCYSNLLERLFTELAPSNVQQEGDLISMAQLRWSSERINGLIERELNHRVRSPQLQSVGDTGSRLMSAYRLCLGDKIFNLLSKQHLDTIKTLNSLSTRVEKWSAPKPVRPARLKD